MRSPLVDITTIIAVESLFIQGKRDPCATKLAGEFADLFIYADSVRYPLPTPSYTVEDYPLEVPTILKTLGTRDSLVVQEIEYSTEDPRFISDEQLDSLFSGFYAWAKSNRYTLRRWLAFHNENWVRLGHQARIKHKFVFALDKLRRDPKLREAACKLKLQPDALCYAFDIVLRLPFYGGLAGEGEYYLSHPIRDAFSSPLIDRSVITAPSPAVRFKEAVASLAPKLTMDKYTALLHELRGTVRDYGLHLMAPGEFDKEVVREIAIKVGLPPRLKDVGKVAGIGSGVVTGGGAITVLSLPAAVAGALISVSSAIWRGHLPAALGRVKWLHWALEWDVEHQAEERK